MQDYRIIDIQENATIGRDQNNDIILDSRGVSRDHALILKQENGYHLIDKGSKNAVWIGSDVFREFELSHGMTFRIADHHLTFMDDDPLMRHKRVCFQEDQAETKQQVKGSETMLMVDFKPEKGTLDSGNISMSTINDRFKTFLQKVYVLAECKDEEELIHSLLLQLILFTRGIGGFFALKDAKGELLYKASKNFSPEMDNKKIDHTTISRVIERSSLCEVREGQGGRVGEKSNHSYLCAPFVSDGRVVGCCYLLGKKKSFFSKLDLDFVRTALLLGAQQYRYLIPQQIEENEEVVKPKEIEKYKDVVVKSANMVQLYGDVKTMSPINVPLLVLGEPGTGKELVADALHKNSRRKGRYVTLNCSAIPEGIFESELFGSVKGAFHNATDRKGKLELADRGTLFLDEIGDMALLLQPKLLRFLENQELTRLGDTRVQKLDVRIVAATNQDLKTMIEKKQFRADLFQRLSCFSLKIPPLRDRVDDIEPLTHFFQNKFAGEYGLPPARMSTKAMEMLKRYTWPGNVRELRNTILRVTVYGKGGLVVPEDLIPLLESGEDILAQKVTSFPSLDDMEKEHIQATLQYARWNISEASKMLGIARSTFYKKVKKYGIVIEPSSSL